MDATNRESSAVTRCLAAWPGRNFQNWPTATIGIRRRSHQPAPPMKKAAAAKTL
jgi:hypothetical protein